MQTKFSSIKRQYHLTQVAVVAVDSGQINNC